MRFCTAVLLLFPVLLLARGKVIYQEEGKGIPAPWLTGPLLAPSGKAVPLGDLNVEPYIFSIAYTGNYDKDWKVVEHPTGWVNYSQTQVQVGVLPWMDFQFNPTVYWNYTYHEASWALGDMPIAIDIQLYDSPPDSYVPSVKLALKQNLPIGKYRNLRPQKKGTDLGGTGSWATGAGLVLGKLIHVTGLHFFNWRLALTYTVPAPVRLKGFNFYGGGFGTDARIVPGQNFQVDVGMEFTLAQTWALALDIVGDWGNRDTYTGKRGIAEDGLPARIGRGYHVNYSLAPGIEYNWNESLGIIGGVWFTIGGRKSPVFTSGVIALNYYL